MNATTQAIIARLPQKPLLTPRDIADAYAVSSTAKILDDIRCGRLPANALDKASPKISYDAAVAYVEDNEVIPSEGKLPTKKEKP